MRNAPRRRLSTSRRLPAANASAASGAGRAASRPSATNSVGTPAGNAASTRSTRSLERHSSSISTRSRSKVIGAPKRIGDAAKGVAGCRQSIDKSCKLAAAVGNQLYAQFIRTEVGRQCHTYAGGQTEGADFPAQTALERLETRIAQHAQRIEQRRGFGRARAVTVDDTTERRPAENRRERFAVPHGDFLEQREHHRELSGADRQRLDNSEQRGAIVRRETAPTLEEALGEPALLRPLAYPLIDASTQGRLLNLPTVGHPRLWWSPVPRPTDT